MARELPPVVMIRWLLRFSRWRLFQMPSTSYSKRVKAMLYFCTLRSRSFSNRQNVESRQLRGSPPEGACLRDIGRQATWGWETVGNHEDDSRFWKTIQATCRRSAQMLWSNGHCVLEATTGREALVAGNHYDGPIDLLLSDVAVPEPSGTVVALELVKSYRDLKILFVSANPLDALDRNDLENFRRLPPDQVDFLEKPFRLLAFLDKVGEMIRPRGRRSADWPQTEAWPKRSDRSA